MVAAAVVGGTLMAACGGDSPTEDPAILGTYSTELGPPGPQDAEANPPGKWQLSVPSSTEAFLTDPTGTRFAPGNPVRIGEDRIVFAPDPNCPTQSGTAGKGTYEWTLDEDALSLTLVSDTCKDRAFVLTSETWLRNP